MWNLVQKTRLGWVKNRTLDSRPKGSWLMNSNPPNAQMFFVEPFAIKEVYCNKNIQIHSRWRHTGGHEMLYLYRFIQEVRQNISTLHFWATEHRYVSYFSFFRNVCEILLSTLEVIWEKEIKAKSFLLTYLNHHNWYMLENKLTFIHIYKMWPKLISELQNEW